MSQTNAIYGSATQLGIDATSTIGAGKRYNFDECTIGLHESLEDMNGLRGTLERSVEATRPGIQRVGGKITMRPTALELSQLLPWILGTVVSSTTYALSNVVIPKYVKVARDNALYGGTAGKVFGYAGCAVDKAVFRAVQGGIPLSLDMDVIGTTETVGNEGTFDAALTIDVTTKPWLFTDLALTVNSVALNPKDFELSIDWKIDKERFLNSLTLLAALKTDCDIQLKCHVPFAGAEAVYNAGSGGVSATAVFTNGVDVLTFTMAALTFMREGQQNAGRNETMLPISGKALHSGTTSGLVTTLALS